MLKRKSKRGFAYYACEAGAECGFMTWDVPTAEDCPECGQSMFKKSGKGRMKTFCINEKCSRFLPEDQRGYYKKKTAEEEAPAGEPKEEKKTTKKSSAKKPAAKKTAGKKTSEKKTAAKKTPEKKTTTRKTKKETKATARLRARKIYSFDPELIKNTFIKSLRSPSRTP
jgi:DNA topoisomerase-1